MNDIYYYLFEIFANIVDISISYYLVHILFESKKFDNRKIYIFLSTIILSFLLKLSNDVLGNGSLESFFIILIIIYLFSKSFYEIKFSKFVLTMCFYIVIIAIIEMTVITCITIIFNLPKNILLENNNSYRIIALLTSKILLIFIAFLISRFSKLKHTQIIPYTSLMIFMLVLNFFIVYFSLHIYSRESVQIETFYIVVVSIVSIIISIISIFIIQKIISSYNKEIRWKNSEEQYKSILKYYKEYEQLNNKMSSERHDFTNHMIAIKEFAASNQNKKIIEYSNNLLENTKKMNKLLKIKNKTISALINYKSLLIEQYDIELKQFINVPESIHINDVDISIILGNALDNAIEACKKCDKRLIDIYINYKNEHLKIEISNTKSGSSIYKDNKIQTTKKDKKNHGFGLENIARAVKKYDGYFNIKDKDDLFILEIFI